LDRIAGAIAAKRHPLTLAHLSMIDADPITLVKAAEAGGFDGIGLRVLPPKGTVLAGEIVGHPAVVTEVRGMLRDSGLALYDAESFSLRPETDIRADYEPALATVAELEGRAVLTSVVDPDPARAFEKYCELCDLGAIYGLKVGLEYISFRDLRTLAEALAYVERSGKSNAGVIVDALHHSRVGGSPDELAAVNPACLAYAQICDAVAEIPAGNDGLLAEARTGRLLPGDGSLWLKDWVIALPPMLPISVEAPVTALAGMTPVERGRVIGEKARGFLADCDQPVAF